MLIDKNKLRKAIKKMQPKTLSDIISVGTFTNCRVGFVAKHYPLELKALVNRGLITLNFHANKYIESQLEKLPYKANNGERDNTQRRYDGY